MPASRATAWLLPGLIALYALAQLLHLGHGRIRHWDEVYHLKVAVSVMADPLLPRLRVDPIRPVSDVDWWNTGIWMHKPILPFWASALSMKVLGLGVFAFRLPSVVLGCLCIALTYALGKRVRSARAGFLAAALFASSAFAIEVVQGVQFGDVTDIHLAAWNLVAVILLFEGVQSGRARYWALAGAASGLAVLSKLFLALAPLCLGPVALVLWKWRRLDAPRVTPRHVLLQWLCAALVAGPVLLFLRHRFPLPFDHSFLYGLHHLDKAIEPVWVHGPEWTWNEMLQRQLREPFALLGAIAIVAFCAAHAASREPAQVLAAIWLAATMGILSLVKMKAPGQLFGAFPAACVAIAWLLGALARRPSPLSAGVALGLVVQIVTFWAGGPRPLLHLGERLEPLRRFLPDVVEHPESARGLVIVAVSLLVVLAAAALARALWRPPPQLLLRLPSLCLPLAVLVGFLAFAGKSFLDLRLHWWDSWSRGAGEAIVRHGPPRAAVFIDGEHADARLDLEIEVFSGQPAWNVSRMPTAGDLRAAAAKGRAPLLISLRAQPYATLPQDPQRKRFEVYDLSRPLSAPAPIAPSFGLAESSAAGSNATLLGASFEGSRRPRARLAWLTSCWKIDRPPRSPVVRVVAQVEGRHVEARQPLAYGLLDGKLAAGDSFCQRAGIELPPDFPRDARLSIALGDLPPLPLAAVAWLD